MCSIKSNRGLVSSFMHIRKHLIKGGYLFCNPGNKTGSHISNGVALTGVHPRAPTWWPLDWFSASNCIKAFPSFKTNSVTGIPSFPTFVTNRVAQISSFLLPPIPDFSANHVVWIPTFVSRYAPSDFGGLNPVLRVKDHWYMDSLFVEGQTLSKSYIKPEILDHVLLLLALSKKVWPVFQAPWVSCLWWNIVSILYRESVSVHQRTLKIRVLFDNECYNFDSIKLLSKQFLCIFCPPWVQWKPMKFNRWKFNKMLLKDSNCYSFSLYHSSKA